MKPQDKQAYLEAAIPDLASYEKVLLDQILAIPAVGTARSTFAIRTVLSRGPLEIRNGPGQVFLCF